MPIAKPAAVAKPVKTAIAKLAAKPAAKPAAKRPVKAAAAPVKKPVAKITAKIAPAKAAPKTVAKPPAKPATLKKPALSQAKPAVKPVIKPAAKQPQKPAAADAPKIKKTKQVRDSFTMPEPEYAVIAQVKKACLKAGFEMKKSDLLRIGISLIKGLDVSTLKIILATLTPLKAGRPKK